MKYSGFDFKVHHRHLFEVYFGSFFPFYIKIRYSPTHLLTRLQQIGLDWIASVGPWEKVFFLFLVGMVYNVENFIDGGVSIYLIR